MAAQDKAVEYEKLREAAWNLNKQLRGKASVLARLEQNFANLEVRSMLILELEHRLILKPIKPARPIPTV